MNADWDWSSLPEDLKRRIIIFGLAWFTIGAVVALLLWMLMWVVVA